MFHQVLKNKKGILKYCFKKIIIWPFSENTSIVREDIFKAYPQNHENVGRRDLIFEYSAACLDSKIKNLLNYIHFDMIYVDKDEMNRFLKHESCKTRIKYQ